MEEGQHGDAIEARERAMAGGQRQERGVLGRVGARKIQREGKGDRNREYGKEATRVKAGEGLPDIVENKKRRTGIGVGRGQERTETEENI